MLKHYLGISSLALTLALLLLAPSTANALNYNGGNGTVDSPYEIATLAQLKSLSLTPDDWDKHYILTADIDAESTNSWNVRDHDGEFSTPKEAMGFSSIGDRYIPFSGSFDGQGYVISNLFINRPLNDYMGLFGRVTGAIISNLGIEGGRVTGNSSIGILVGSISNSTTIVNCYATDTVSVAKYYQGSGNSIGGLVGSMYIGCTITDSYATGTVSGEYATGGLVGAMHDGSALSNCYAIGSVTGDDHTGGLVGIAGENSTISYSYAAGTVSGDGGTGGIAGSHSGTIIIACYSTASISGNYNIGGLVGSNSGTITACYSTGSVSGYGSSVGGLVGIQYYGIISTCYATGPISGSVTGGHTGGLIGYNRYNDSSLATWSYWDIETSRQSTSRSGTGLSSAHMLHQNSFTGFDFSTEPMWAIVEGSTRPYLAYQTTALLEGTATVTSPTSVALDTGYVYNIDGSGVTLDEYGIAYREEGSDTIYYHPIISSPLTEGAGTELNGISLNELTPDTIYLYRTYAIDSNNMTHLSAERSIHRVVHVDIATGSPTSTGTSNTPVDSLGVATRLVSNNGTIKLDAGDYSEIITIDQPLTLELNGTTGIVSIGN